MSHSQSLNIPEKIIQGLINLSYAIKTFLVISNAFENNAFETFR